MKFERAVIAGSGMGGLAAAAALHESCDEVVIVDKDQIPEEPTPRHGVPQDAQLHNLLTRAQVHLEDLLPGFAETLSQHSAGNANVSSETHVYELGVRMPERDLGLRLMSAWRPVIEHAARTILLDFDNISIRSLTRATSLVLGKGGGLEGLRTETGTGNEIVEAPIVVDATGMGSSAPKWLREHGLERPKIDSLQVGQWYVSTLVERPPGMDNLNDFWLTFPMPPNTRGALISPVGDNKWYVSVSGHSCDPIPKSFEEIKTHSRGLEDETVAGLLEKVVPVGEPNFFGKPRATWRHYEQIEEPLAGFLPIGDSIASLNPLFGQGISVATWQASELKETLKQGLELSQLTREYLRLAAGACAAAWTLGQITNFETDSLTPAFWDRLARAIELDPEIHRRYVGIWHLLEPLSLLVEPKFVSEIDKAVS